MNDEMTNLDQADEESLTYRVSDEALEAAAGMAGGQQYTPITNIVNCTLSPGQCCVEGRAAEPIYSAHAEPNTTGILVEADEDILTSTVSDEGLEAAASMEGEASTLLVSGCLCVR
jgi:hypothetical protein